jgi:NOL1/NOP2/fmu family ribosome biogenesis protein
MVEQYLKGNVIPYNYKGYTGLYYAGYQIGFGKVSNNQIKNNLPKGIRL